jgi:hypothetical protein
MLLVKRSDKRGGGHFCNELVNQVMAEDFQTPAPGKPRTGHVITCAGPATPENIVEMQPWQL